MVKFATTAAVNITVRLARAEKSPSAPWIQPMLPRHAADLQTRRMSSRLLASGVRIENCGCRPRADAELHQLITLANSSRRH